jgi:hypothetical protein
VRTLPAAAVSAQTIVEHLRAGGATALRASNDFVWVLGHAPSGRLIQLLYWPNHGYCVSWRSDEDSLVECVEVFENWEIAVAQALQA